MDKGEKYCIEAQERWHAFGERTPTAQIIYLKSFGPCVLSTLARSVVVFMFVGHLVACCVDNEEKSCIFPRLSTPSNSDPSPRSLPAFFKRGGISGVGAVLRPRRRPW